MQKIADNTFLINKRGKYCSYCGKYTVRVSAICPHCRANWPRRGGRCYNCEAAIDPEWSYCEICGMETARAQRLKRAKMLSHRAKLPKLAHSQLPPPHPKSPDLFGPDPDIAELDSIELTLSSCDQLLVTASEEERTPATESTNVNGNMEIVVPYDQDNSSCLPIINNNMSFDATLSSCDQQLEIKPAIESTSDDIDIVGPDSN